MFPDCVSTHDDGRVRAFIPPEVATGVCHSDDPHSTIRARHSWTPRSGFVQPVFRSFMAWHQPQFERIREGKLSDESSSIPAREWPKTRDATARTQTWSIQTSADFDDTFTNLRFAFHERVFQAWVRKFVAPKFPDLSACWIKLSTDTTRPG